MPARYLTKKDVDFAELPPLCDNVDALWSNECSSYNGINDVIPLGAANTLSSSLVLIHPASLAVCVDTEGGQFGQAKRKVRAIFRLNHQQFKLIITDLDVEKSYLKNSKQQTRDARRRCLMVV